MGQTQEPQKDKDILLHAYEAAKTWSTLIVSLSTGVIVFTAIFKKDIAQAAEPLQATYALLTSWILLGLAILFGILYLGSLASQLNEGRKEKLNIYGVTQRVLAFLQWITFLVGLGFFGYFAIVNLS